MAESFPRGFITVSQTDVPRGLSLPVLGGVVPTLLFVLHSQQRPLKAQPFALRHVKRETKKEGGGRKGYTGVP